MKLHIYIRSIAVNKTEVSKKSLGTTMALPLPASCIRHCNLSFMVRVQGQKMNNPLPFNI